MIYNVRSGNLNPTIPYNICILYAYIKNLDFMLFNSNFSINMFVLYNVMKRTVIKCSLHRSITKIEPIVLA